MSTTRPRKRKASRQLFKKRRTNGGVTVADVKQIILAQLETKFREVSFITQIVSSDVPILTEMTDIDQGITNNLRIGNKISVKNITFKLCCTKGSGTEVDSIFRIIVAQSKRGNLTTANFPNAVSGNDMDTVWVLFDEMFCLDVDAGPGTYNFSRTIKPRVSDIEFNDATGSNPKDNPIYWFMVSDIAAAAVEPVCSGYMRLNFKDI